MKQNPPIRDQMALDDRTVLVRPVTDEERCQYCEGDFGQPFYTLTSLDGKLVAIVKGESKLAFRIAEKIQSKPLWIH
jgi:hypothetical protein